jgi:hypothetical protein
VSLICENHHYGNANMVAKKKKRKEKRQKGEQEKKKQEIKPYFCSLRNFVEKLAPLIERLLIYRSAKSHHEQRR